MNDNLKKNSENLNEIKKELIILKKEKEKINDELNFYEEFKKLKQNFLELKKEKEILLKNTNTEIIKEFQEIKKNYESLINEKNEVINSLVNEFKHLKKRNNKLQKQKNKIKNGHRKLFDEMGKLLDSSYQLKLFQNSLIKEKENLLKYINDTKDYIENKSKIEILMKENKKLKNTINFYKKNINILKESFNKKIYEKFEKKSNLLKETLFKYEKLSKNYNELLEEKQNLIKENKNLLIFREKYNFLLKDKKNFEEFILNQMKKNEIVIKEKKNNGNSKTISFNEF